MSASFQRQRQSGSDSSVTTKEPVVVESSRDQPEQVTTQLAGPSQQTTQQKGYVQVGRARPRIGCTITFTIKVNNNLPPQK